MLEGSGSACRLLGGRERALSAEHHCHDALVLGSVETGRAGADALRQGDLRSVERRPDTVVLHVDGEPESGDWIPVGVRADRPELEARIAGHIRWNDDVLPRAAVG